MCDSFVVNDRKVLNNKRGASLKNRAPMIAPVLPRKYDEGNADDDYMLTPNNGEDEYYEDHNGHGHDHDEQEEVQEEVDEEENYEEESQVEYVNDGNGNNRYTTMANKAKVNGHAPEDMKTAFVKFHGTFSPQSMELKGARMKIEHPIFGTSKDNKAHHIIADITVASYSNPLPISFSVDFEGIKLPERQYFSSDGTASHFILDKKKDMNYPGDGAKIFTNYEPQQHSFVARHSDYTIDTLDCGKPLPGDEGQILVPENHPIISILQQVKDNLTEKPRLEKVGNQVLVGKAFYNRTLGVAQDYFRNSPLTNLNKLEVVCKRAHTSKRHPSASNKFQDERELFTSIDNPALRGGLIKDEQDLSLTLCIKYFVNK